MLLLLAIATALAVFISSPVVDSHYDGSTLARRLESWQQRATTARDVAIAMIGEDPHLVPNIASDPLPICPGESGLRRRALAEGLALMRATDQGLRLYDVLIREGVCIRTGKLEFNSAYASSRWSPDAGWSNSEIVINRERVDFLYPDLQAAILVHEATHIERAIDKTACYYANACTILENGVELEEEIAAHAAEAEWWIAAFGRDGKDWAIGPDHSENQLKAAYLRGPGDLRQFVRAARSDPREGKGL